MHLIRSNTYLSKSIELSTASNIISLTSCKYPCLLKVEEDKIWAWVNNCVGIIVGGEDIIWSPWWVWTESYMARSCWILIAINLSFNGIKLSISGKSAIKDLDVGIIDHRVLSSGTVTMLKWCSYHSGSFVPGSEIFRYVEVVLIVQGRATSPLKSADTRDDECYGSNNKDQGFHLKNLVSI